MYPKYCIVLLQKNNKQITEKIAKYVRDAHAEEWRML